MTKYHFATVSACHVNFNNVITQYQNTDNYKSVTKKITKLFVSASLKVLQMECTQSQDKMCTLYIPPDIIVAQPQVETYNFYNCTYDHRHAICFRNKICIAEEKTKWSKKKAVPYSVEILYLCIKLQCFYVTTILQKYQHFLSLSWVTHCR